MRKLLLFFALCMSLSCTKKVEQDAPIQDDTPKIDTLAYLAERELMFDSIYAAECKRLGWHSEKQSVIAWFCAFEQTGLPLTDEEIAYWDSLIEAGDGEIIIRDAERKLDTIINHFRYCFTTDL